MSAVKCGSVAIVRLLLDKKASYKCAFWENGRTSLSYAVIGGHEAVVSLLLDRKSVLDRAPRHGLSAPPLFYAVERCCLYSMIQLLLDRGACINSTKEEKHDDRTIYTTL